VLGVLYVQVNYVRVQYFARTSVHNCRRGICPPSPDDVDDEINIKD